jgi:hypothetical protein
LKDGFTPAAIAADADGSPNSCDNPAQAGFTVSFYMHGIGAIQLGFGPPPQIADLTATVGYCSAQVINAALIGDFVYQVDVTMPASPSDCTGLPGILGTSARYQFPVTFYYNGEIVGVDCRTLYRADPEALSVDFAPGRPIPMMVYVK